jgi:hypothetical protein
MSEIHPQESRISPARRCARWAGLYFALAALTGCRAPTPHATAPDRAPAPPPEARPLDGSYDWHVLVIAPFGSVLKQVPLTLHEVLLFRDQARGGTAADDAECYASDAPAPRFVGRTPDEYLLCFKEDRLARIQASVRLTAAEAPEVFAAACTRWLKNAMQATMGAAAPGAAANNGAAPETGAPRATDAQHMDAQNTGPQSADACKGREGSIRFNAHLGEEATQAETPAVKTPPTEAQQSEASPTETTLSITLDGVANP